MPVQMCATKKDPESNELIPSPKHQRLRATWQSSSFGFLYPAALHLGTLPSSSADKESTCDAGDPSLIPGSGRSPEEGTGYQLQYSWAFLVA